LYEEVVGFWAAQNGLEMGRPFLRHDHGVDYSSAASGWWRI
jgi:hypothetical protein